VADRSEHLLQIEHINRDAFQLWLVTPLADSLTGGDTVDSYKPWSLANRLQTVGHIPELEAARIALGLVRGLSMLHECGLLHGDVSPSNILTVHGRWVLADPGLVRFQGEHGICRNRVYYPQPKVTLPADDLYAVGIILWEMVSGLGEMVSGQERLRLDGQMLGFLSKKHLPTATFLRRAAGEKPEQRYLHAAEMLQDLESLAAELAQSSAAGDSLYRLLRPLRTG
jgi:serine/threonine protein kinase